MPNMTLAGAPVISVYSLTLLLLALVVVWWMKDQTLVNVVVGVIATNATTVVNFWVGSSRGSERKDEVIAATRSGGVP